MKTQILLSTSRTFLLQKPNTVNLFLKQAVTFALCIRIKFAINNIYCTFWSISGKRTIRVLSTGIKKIKASKRRLFFYAKPILNFFFLQLQRWRKKYRNKKALIFYSIQTPKKFKKIILKTISSNASAINFEFSKAFNGCKEKKKRRKKRLGFRSFK